VGVGLAQKLLGKPKAVKAMLRGYRPLGGEQRLGDFAKLLQVRVLFYQ
jgi:hypothetical protein